MMVVRRQQAIFTPWVVSASRLAFANNRAERSAHSSLQFIFSQIPYSSRRTSGSIFTDIKAGIPPAEPPADLPPDLELIWEKLEECWDTDPSNRPPAVSLLAWFKGRIACPFRQPLALEQVRNDADMMDLTGGLGSLNENMQQAVTAAEGLEAANSSGTVSISSLF
jgi:hypothetical protein